MSAPELLTSVLPSIEHRDGGADVTFAEIGRSWSGVHGGVLVGALLDAAAEHTGLVPATVTAHLHAVAQPGAGTITTDTVAAGRSLASTTAVLEQDGVRRASASLVLTVPPEGPVQHWPGARRDLSTVPAPEDLDRLTGMELIVPIAVHFDIRAVEGRPLAGGPEPLLTAWIRLLPAPTYREAVAAVLLDALAPALYAVGTTPVAVPTVEFTIHFTPAQPSDEWFLVRQRTTWSTAAFCVDEAELCTPEGRVVATARQLRRILAARS
jgi:acyl-CoA thioesterase